MPDVQLARERLRWAVERSKRSSVAIGRAFIRDEQGKASTNPAPLVEMLRGGRGGEVRLKLYLSIVLLAVKAPHKVTFPPRAWAEMLALDDPDLNGARRINDALNWLAGRELIAISREPGKPPTVALRDEAGSGSRYRRPGRVTYYTWASIPVEFWSHGWILNLSASAVACLLILLELDRGKRQENRSVAPRRLAESYGLSPETWKKGTQELEAKELVGISRATTGELAEWRRYRNNFVLHPEVFESDPY